MHVNVRYQSFYCPEYCLLLSNDCTVLVDVIHNCHLFFHCKLCSHGNCDNAILPQLSHIPYCSLFMKHSGRVNHNVMLSAVLNNIRLVATVSSKGRVMSLPFTE